MPRRLRLRDYLSGHTEPPRSGSSDPEELVCEVEAMDGIDPEDAVRLCRGSQAKMWAKAEEIMREEGRRGE